MIIIKFSYNEIININEVGGGMMCALIIEKSSIRLQFAVKNLQIEHFHSGYAKVDCNQTHSSSNFIPPTMICKHVIHWRMLENPEILVQVLVLFLPPYMILASALIPYDSESVHLYSEHL